MKKQSAIEQDEVRGWPGEQELDFASPLRQIPEQELCPRCGYRQTRLDRLLRPTPQQLLQRVRQRPLPLLAIPKRLRGGGPDYRLEILWSLQAGSADKFFSALRRWPAVLQDPDVWKFTVGRWSKQKLDPDKKVRDRAREYLWQVGEELSAIGSGPVSKQESETRRKNKREKNYEHTTNRNHRKSAQRLVTRINDEAKWYCQNGRTKEQAHKEAKKYVLSEWQQTSRAKDKPAILALVKEILSHN